MEMASLDWVDPCEVGYSTVLNIVTGENPGDLGSYGLMEQCWASSSAVLNRIMPFCNLNGCGRMSPCLGSLCTSPFGDSSVEEAVRGGKGYYKLNQRVPCTV